jgi:hypothetical protein
LKLGPRAMILYPTLFLCGGDAVEREVWKLGC